MAKTTKVTDSGAQELQHSRGWILGLGILFLVLGCIGLSMEMQLTLFSMVFFGVLLIMCGVTQFADVFKRRYWKGKVWQTLIALFYIAAGCVVIYDPFLASTLITAMLAGALIFIGATRIVMAFSLKESKGWLWLLLAGVTAIILGILIMLQWPISGLWVIGLFIAIEMIVTGWTYIFIALSLGRERKTA